MSDFYIDPSAIVDENVTIGKNTKIWHFTHVQSNTILGDGCTLGQNVNVGNNVLIGNFVKIQNNVSIYEGVTLEDYVFCGPSCVFTNILLPRCEFPQRGSEFYSKTLVKKSASIGANATIVCGNTIGKYALVGAGSVVTKDVPDHALVLGNPAKIVGWVDKKGKMINFTIDEVSDCKRFTKKGNMIFPLKEHNT
jgi:UDP-2-acetamido-3-amino-2,3-dideoxy-glucuronate N-acetyltransferase